MREIKDMYDACKEARERLDDCTKVYVKKTPFHAEEENRKIGKTCGICGGHNTFQTYYRSGATSDGSVWEQEIRCDDCGGYTLYEFSDRM